MDVPSAPLAGPRCWAAPTAPPYLRVGSGLLQKQVEGWGCPPTSWVRGESSVVGAGSRHPGGRRGQPGVATGPETEGAGGGPPKDSLRGKRRPHSGAGATPEETQRSRRQHFKVAPFSSSSPEGRDAGPRRPGRALVLLCTRCARLRNSSRIPLRLCVLPCAVGVTVRTGHAPACEVRPASPPPLPTTLRWPPRPLRGLRLWERGGGGGVLTGVSRSFTGNVCKQVVWDGGRCELRTAWDSEWVRARLPGHGVPGTAFA